MSSHRYAWLLAVITLCVVPATAQYKAGDLKIKPYVFENGNSAKVDAELAVLVKDQRCDAGVSARPASLHYEDHASADEVCSLDLI